MAGQTMRVDRAWKELSNASGQSFASFGEKGENWNAPHFLDAAEFTAAFAVGYDWLHHAWTDQQKETIWTAIVTLGLQYGLEVCTNNAAYGWCGRPLTGNWNCVCNGGLTMGALTILRDDITNTASRILNETIPMGVANATSDGTWTETANYLYFGTTSHVDLLSLQRHRQLVRVVSDESRMKSLSGVVIKTIDLRL
ncbi:hypothetical protein M407DRAFT_32055 [Tulasnella calospora MUT 4182]|uniref:Uncharacterized protein n=1 Tax=Tulasnella calospora MUT 4182 TaxID=1051891 RepID=A0A0C3KA30_9AGAM|nr:hypothetical protein M407DRAFT_32055 [Tulasnella calospora MUT 4182]